MMQQVHVWERVEIELRVEGDYANPYADVDAWVDLEGPGFSGRCRGFWDGGKVFRVRVLAIRPGAWRWRSGSAPADPGIAGRTGGFEAVAWRETEKRANPNRRGMLRPSRNGHAFEYADGTPFFLLGDTWWAAPTHRFAWHEDDTPRPLGPAAGFKDYVSLRKGQGFNCIAMIAAFPNWGNDGKPAKWKLNDGTVVRSAWKQAGTESAKEMTTERGDRAFPLPGRAPGLERYVPDLERINPRYFQSMDLKIDYLNAQGFVPFIEVARRDIGQLWKRFYPWPASYTRYLHYVWSRYQAHICLFSPIHFDTPADSLPAAEWNAAAVEAVARYGAPPFGTLAGTNANPSSLRNWGHVDRATWLGFHQVGNRRTHDLYPFLTEIFRAEPPVPGINGEPYYDGMEDAEPGSDLAALYCRSGLYGSVLSGGLGGHIYGAGGWQGGLWSGEVEDASAWPVWEVIRWASADQMRHGAAFFTARGSRYQELVPASELIDPGRSGTPESLRGWAYCARTPDRALFLLYFERDCPRARLNGAVPDAAYEARWFDPRTGDWLTGQRLRTDGTGSVELPPFPDGRDPSSDDWALMIDRA
jgi:hypothetical protein